MITTVTDPVLISAIERHGGDTDEVKFARDYCAESPYAKTYVNERTGGLYQVICGLPMARKTDGSLLVPGWSQYGGSLVAKTNLFDGEIAGTRIALSAVNAQPSGALTGDYATWNPILKVGGEEVEPVDGPYLLEVDPLNPNYEENTIEWDYGICKRRVRVIEGRFRERWVFTTNPGVAVQIKHGFEGDLPIVLGKGSPHLDIQVDGDAETVTTEAFDLAFAMHGSAEIGASGTFYPDSDPESTTVDGMIRREVAYPYETWSTIRGAASGTYLYPSYIEGYVCWYKKGSGPSGPVYEYLTRAIALFDTSSLPSIATITGTTLSVYGNYVEEDYTYPYLAVTSSSPASNTDLAVGDYSSLGSSAYGTCYYTSYSASGYNNITLSAGSGVVKGGISKYGLREYYYDMLGNVPDSINNVVLTGFGFYMSEKGSGYKPKLVVDYTLPYKGPLFGNHYRRRRV